MHMMLRELLEIKRSSPGSLFFALVHLGSRSFFESLNVNSHIFASLFLESQQQKNAFLRGRINLIIAGDTASLTPTPKKTALARTREGRTTRGFERGFEKITQFLRAFLLLLRDGKKTFGRDRPARLCDRPLFCAVFGHFLNRKKRNKPLGDNLVRSRARGRVSIEPRGSFAWK